MTKISAKDLKHIPKTKGLAFIGDFFKLGLKGTNYFTSRQKVFGNLFHFNVHTGTYLVVLRENNQKCLCF